MAFIVALCNLFRKVYPNCLFHRGCDQLHTMPTLLAGNPSNLYILIGFFYVNQRLFIGRGIYMCNNRAEVIMMFKINPYRPGAGLMPTYLAGRDEDIYNVEQMFKALTLNIPTQSVIFSGLRGVV